MRPGEYGLHPLMRMKPTFDIAEQYSRSLDRLMGPERASRRPVERARAWVLQSLGRRTLARALGAGVLAIAGGLLIAGFKDSFKSAGKELKRKLAA
jgi:hypothetical protein